ncbi:MAG: hypothetical protein AAGC49_12755, partial [Brevundimonas sp.]
MSSTAAWKPAETAQGGRAFVATIGDVDVLVTFAGDATGRLAGTWDARDAHDGSPLLDGDEAALAGTSSAVQVYAALVSIADRLTAVLVPTPTAPVEYRLIRLGADEDASAFQQATEAALNLHAA